MSGTTTGIIDELGEISIQKLAENLDDEQIEAVMAESTNVLVKANAGAGKTRVLTSRVAYLLATGVPEDQIMLLTFTNRASREMVERVQTLLGGKKLSILGGTFHRIAAMFLRMYADRLGYEKNFTVLDPDDAKSLIEESRKKYLEENGIKKSQFPEKKIIYHYYSSAINKGQSYAWVNAEEQDFHSSILAGIEEIIDDYIDRKKQSNAMDFDDLLVNFSAVLKIPDVRREINTQYRYVLVDEYQDINGIQNSIIESLNKGNQHLFVVGDPNQAIYSWRGSDVQFIESFQKRHLDARVHYITYNYRSDGEILRLAEQSINHNYENRRVTKITPYLGYEHQPTMHQAMDDFKQAEYIVKMIQQQVRRGTPYEEIAVLLRTNFLTRILEKTFRQYGIPYRLLSGYSFFERKHVKDVLAFLRFSENPNDESAFLRVASMFDGIGEKTVAKLFVAFRGAGYDLQALKTIKATKTAKLGVDTMISILEQILKASTIRKMIQVIVDEYYDAYLKRTEEDYKERMKDVEYLLEAADGYSDLSLFIGDMVLDEQQAEAQGNHVVTITTIHKAKGLEWDCVVLPYLNQVFFPTMRVNSHREIEEERRLFYVATTRARKYLHMCYINWQSHSHQQMYPSIFIDELSPVLYDEVR